MLRRVPTLMISIRVSKEDKQNLLQALRPYLTEHRILKLEKAMRAAKIAGLATTFLGSADGFLFGGR